MNSIIKKIIILLSLSVVVLTVIYYSHLKKVFFKNDVYIIFDIETDTNKELDWSKHTHLFPKLFNPKNVLIDLKELLRLNNRQQMQFDSINKGFYQHPRKIVKLKNNERAYSISVDPNIAIDFVTISRKSIKISKLSKLNILSLDSLIQIIPSLELIQSKRVRNNIKRFENIRFNIIELDKNKTTIIEVEPIVIEYN